MPNYKMNQRPRRLRRTGILREMVAETKMETSNLIQPLFVLDSKDFNQDQTIESLPGLKRLTLDSLYREVEELLNLGISAVSLFPVIAEHRKNSQATYALETENINLVAIRELKKRFPELMIMSDIAMDPYSSDGHDGVVSEQGEILNDETLSILAEMSLLAAEAGVDILGPSDMMDGRVGVIRNSLEEKGFTDTIIMSYTAKYASSYYGPFRDALDSAPKFGDKKTYQMNFRSKRDALAELELDIQEGADIVMVKPAGAYLDIISLFRENTNLPVAAYQVSGEYSLIKAADKLGYVDGESLMIESLTSIKRAGADIILTYFAKDMAKMLK